MLCLRQKRLLIVIFTVLILSQTPYSLAENPSTIISYEGTKAWEMPQQLFPSNSLLFVKNPQILSNEQGKQVALWIAYNETYSEIHCQTFTGESWLLNNTIFIISGNYTQISTFKAVLDSENKLHVVWKDAGVHYRSLWNNVLSLVIDLQDMYPTFDLALLSSNRLALVGQEENNLVYLIFDGNSWSESTTIINFDDLEVPYYIHTLDLAAGTNDNLFVCCTGSKYDPIEERSVEILLCLFYDGTTWQRTSEPSVEKPYIGKVTFDETGKVHLFYTSFNSGNVLWHQVWLNKWSKVEKAVEFPQDNTERHWSSIINHDVAISGSDIFIAMAATEWTTIGFNLDLLIAHYRNGWQWEPIFDDDDSYIYETSIAINKNGDVFLLAIENFTPNNFTCADLIFLYGEKLFNYKSSHSIGFNLPTTILLSSVTVAMFVLIRRRKNRQNL